MKTIKFILNDMKMVIGAINSVRNEWIAAINEAAKEIREGDSKISHDAAINAVLFREHIMEKYNRLIALYGVLGNGSAEYLEALASVDTEETLAEVVPIKKAS